MRRRRTGTQPRKTHRKRVLGRYKSSLEKYCADMLVMNNISFMYEEIDYTLQDSFVYNGVYMKMTKQSKELSDRTNKVVLRIGYTPDFVGKDHNFIIETKGFTPSQHTFPLRWKMFLKMLHEKGGQMPALFMPKNKQQVDETIEEILRLIKDGKI